MSFFQNNHYLVAVRQLERRTSDISVSSQSSLEEDDPEKRKKRFARKGSRESSLQYFLEDKLLESKFITKGRHSSSSSISMEISMDEDSTFVEVERNPALVSLKKFIYGRFAARDQQDSKKSQQEIKQKRSRMQQQHATITEEPTGLTDPAESKTTVKRKK
uniref:Uncharacterized protein n=1 Tax=Magallana gigas TaxID=29159 RepID=A0A8W8J2E9_MAGGI